MHTNFTFLTGGFGKISSVRSIIDVVPGGGSVSVVAVVADDVVSVALVLSGWGLLNDKRKKFCLTFTKIAFRR